MLVLVGRQQQIDILVEDNLDHAAATRIVDRLYAFGFRDEPNGVVVMSAERHTELRGNETVQAVLAYERRFRLDPDHPYTERQRLDEERRLLGLVKGPQPIPALAGWSWALWLLAL
ncbi:hypothetical protein [Pseudonocardia sp. TRM90224]|uniref:hypothetical protein n=1 Tax=Pseudonocardia sp. TRM90224 TaxID=2812678 RepID=UPI001E5E72E6|nr:hypothetical protein [Pseudonocardia sp. TRM90224]